MKTYKEKKYNQSQIYWEYLRSKTPKKGLVHFNLGNIYYLQGQYEKAIKSYSKVIDLESDLWQMAGLFMAKSHAGKENPKAAKKVLKSLLRSKHLRPNVKILIKDELKKISLDIKNKSKKNIPIEFPIGLKFFKQQKYREAILNLELASNTYESAELRLILGISYFKTGVYDKSKGNLDAAAKLTNDPDIIHNTKVLKNLIVKERDKESKAPTQRNLSIVLDTSLNYTTNPLTISQADKGTKESQVTNNLSFSHSTVEGKSYYLTSDYAVSIDQSFTGTDTRFVDHTLTLGNSFRWKSGKFDISPEGSYQESGKKPYLASYGGLSGVSYYPFSGGRMILDYSLTKSISQREEFSYLEGEASFLRFTYGVTKEKFDISINFVQSEDKYNDSETNVLSNVAYGSSVSLFLFPVSNITISSTLSYQYKKYADNPVTKFSQLERNSSLNVGISYDFTDKFSAYFNTNLSFEENNLSTDTSVSNDLREDDLFDFDERVTLGVTWTMY